MLSTQEMNKKIDAIKKAKKLVEVETEKLGKSCADFLLRTIPNLKEIIVYGYTPGFNDGEPCTHSSEAMLNRDCIETAPVDDYDDSDDDFLVYRLLEEAGYYEAGYTEQEEIFEKVLPEIDYSTFSDSEKEILNTLQDYCDKTYGTDYMTYFWIEDNKLKIYEGEYECGY